MGEPFVARVRGESLRIVSDRFRTQQARQLFS